MDADLEAKLLELKKRPIAAKLLSFPELWKNYAAWCEQQVWENYMMIIENGRGNKSLTFTAVEFFNRENIM